MAKPIKRPVVITIACLLSYAWVIIAFPGIFSPDSKKIGEWYPALLGLITAFTFIAVVGIWHMRQWGVDLYLISFFIKQITLFLLEKESYIELSLSVVFIILFLFYYKKMGKDL